MKSTTVAKVSTDFVPNSLTGQGAAPRALSRRGVAHKDAKLTPTKVHEVRRMYDAKTPLAKIAAKFGISKNHVCGIGKRRYWAWLAEDQSKEGAA